MVIGALPALVKVGQIVYRIATTGGKYFPKTTKVLKEQGAFEGAQIGAGLGSFVANVEFYFEQEGRLDGIPTPFDKRNNNRFGQTRDKVFKSARNRCYIPKRTNRYSKKRGRYRGR